MAGAHRQAAAAAGANALVPQQLCNSYACFLCGRAAVKGHDCAVQGSKWRPHRRERRDAPVVRAWNGDSGAGVDAWPIAAVEQRPRCIAVRSVAQKIAERWRRTGRRDQARSTSILDTPANRKAIVPTRISRRGRKVEEVAAEDRGPCLPGNAVTRERHRPGLRQDMKCLRKPCTPRRRRSDRPAAADGGVAVAEAAQKIRLEAAVREKLGVDLVVVEARHRAAIEPDRARREDQIGALQRGVAQRRGADRARAWSRTSCAPADCGTAAAGARRSACRRRGSRPPARSSLFLVARRQRGLEPLLGLGAAHEHDALRLRVGSGRTPFRQARRARAAPRPSPAAA